MKAITTKDEFMKKDWEQYIDEEKNVVVAELEAKGYEVAEEALGIYNCWNVTLQRGDEWVELTCDASEQDEVDNGTIAPDDASWWVALICVWDAKDREATERFYPED